MSYDYLVVGAGLYGAVFAYEAKKAGKTVKVIDRRNHTGGNIYCENVNGINVHKYGAHIFHTSNKEVWDFVNSIVEFNRYTNSPVANYKGKLYNLPFNMNTFNRLWGVTTPAEAEAKIAEQREEAIEALGGREPQNLEEQALTLVGKDIFNILIKEYTEKQWGRKCSELPAFIIKRLPVRMVFDNNYFNDRYQGIPIGGYNRLIDGLLQGTECRTGADFFQPQYREWRKYARKLVYTGAIDEYFDYSLGQLDWRTVMFKTRVENIPNYQGNAVVNYTEREVPFTRIIEHKFFEFGKDSETGEPIKGTIITREYPVTWEKGMEPYYPVNDDRNTNLYHQYAELAAKEGVLFGGRLAEYRYYDMDDTVAAALKLAATELY